MAKYRLRCRQNEADITLTEIDTESRAWYIQAEHREAALAVLAGMGEALCGVEEILINGEDVTEELFRRVRPAGMVLAGGDEPPLPEEEMPADEGYGVDIPLPDDDEYIPPEEPAYRPPTLADIQAASRRQESAPEEPPASAPAPAFSLPEGLPQLADVLPAEALRPAKPAGEKKEFDGIFLGKKPIKGSAAPIGSITE